MGEKRYDEVEGWRAEFQNDPQFGGANTKTTIAEANNVLNMFGTPQEVGRLKAELNRTGLGNFRVLLRGLARVARLIGSGANKGKTTAERLYPNLKP